VVLFVLSLSALICGAALMVAVPNPISAEPKVLPVAQGQTACKVEEVGYRYHRIATAIVRTIIDDMAITDLITDPAIMGMGTPITTGPTIIGPTGSPALASGSEPGA
jgi:hypothetical protein